MKGVSIFQAVSGEDKTALVPVSIRCALIVTFKESAGGFVHYAGPKAPQSEGEHGMLRVAKALPAHSGSPRGRANEKRAFEKVLLTAAIHGIKFKSPLSGPAFDIHGEVPMSTNIVSSTAASALQERWERLRTHKRIISRVKLLVEWEQGGAKETANAVTVDVSHSGCMAVVGADLPLHRKVRLIHPETGRKAEAEVVWRSHEAWDAGFELLKPDATFWNLK